MDMELRAVKEDESKRFLTACEAAFGEDLPDDEWADFKHVLEIDRTIAAFDGDSIVGTAGAFSFRLTVPGGAEVPAAGVTVVGVLPSHRRRGLATKMMRRQLDDVRATGEPVAILWASEGSIYQRFGYGLASLGLHIDVLRTKTRFLNDPGPSGAVRLVAPIENIETLSAIYDRVRLERPGMVARSEKWWRHHTLPDPERHRDGGGHSSAGSSSSTPRRAPTRSTGCTTSGKPALPKVMSTSRNWSPQVRPPNARCGVSSSTSI